jgi:hypothetical protein
LKLSVHFNVNDETDKLRGAGTGGGGDGILKIFWNIAIDRHGGKEEAKNDD